MKTFSISLINSFESSSIKDDKLERMAVKTKDSNFTVIKDMENTNIFLTDCGEMSFNDLKQVLELFIRLNSIKSFPSNKIP